MDISYKEVSLSVPTGVAWFLLFKRPSYLCSNFFKNLKAPLVLVEGFKKRLIEPLVRSQTQCD
jgi:hypothetical protein